jgi:hypothetical protein
VAAGDGWIHELRHDGFRILALKDGDTIRLWSRNGRDWSGEFVAITEAMRALLPTCPAHLCPSAKAEWKRLAGQMHTLRIVTEFDRSALAAYCQAMAAGPRMPDHVPACMADEWDVLTVGRPDMPRVSIEIRGARSQAPSRAHEPR